MRQLIFLLSCTVASVLADRVVTTNSGPVKGITVSSGKLDIEAYLGIPYAEPPVDSLRFRKPVPKRSWTDTYDASRKPPTCYQNASSHYYEPNVDNMSEDCLYLNLWVPYSNGSQPKPIILFTHGSLFNLGSSNMQLYDGTNLARFGDVIVATVNYRVGVFGFYLAFIEEADGNMGIYDQIVALKWIKDNAKSFGGDPENIVLMGEGSGGYITAGHLSSPLTKNLFKRVIIESGASLCTLLLDDNEGLYRNSQSFAHTVGCANKSLSLESNPQSVVECLKRLPAQELANAEGVLKQRHPVTFYARTGDAYMPIPAVHLLKEGYFKDTEMLIGLNEAEGTWFLTGALPQYFGEYGVNRTDYLPKRFAFQLLRIIFRNIGSKKEKEISEHYIGSIQNGTAETFASSMAMAMGDEIVLCNALYQAEYHSLRNPVYFYLFTRRPSSTPSAEWMKTTHFDELQYVFGNPLFQSFTPEEIALSNRIMTRWVSFAKTGKPDAPGLVKWPKYTRGDPAYLEIQDEERIVHSRPDNHRCEFWRERFQANIDIDIISKIRRYAD